MTPNDRLRTFEDVIYLVVQMVHAERRIDLTPHLVFYYESWSPPNAVRLTSDEERFFGDAMLEAFLLSYRNLLDFFHRPKRSGKNPHRDSLAEVDFGFQRALVANADAEFERVSKHLAHLSEVRRTRTSNEAWNLTATLIECRQTLKDFFKHCFTHYPEACSALQGDVSKIISGLDFLGTTELSFFTSTPAGAHLCHSMQLSVFRYRLQQRPNKIAGANAGFRAGFREAFGPGVAQLARSATARAQ